jgi:putative hydrolase of the HAD superfamily
MKIAAIGLDADDTLWHNEDHFSATEEAFADLLSPWVGVDVARAELLKTETNNLHLFGYGVKSFTLSMIEAAMTLSNGEISSSDLAVLLERGKDMLERPAEMLPGVIETLATLATNHPLLLITKGDLHHQHRKVEESQLGRWFRSVEIVREKDVSTYADVLRRHDLRADEFVMVGNSVKSDVLPAVELGAVGVHIPYHFTWAHEVVDVSVLNGHTRNEAGSAFWELQSIRELPALVERLQG